MKQILVMISCILVLFLFSCKDKFLNYPYAENNSIAETYYDRIIIDDYKWLEVDEEVNKQKKKWISEEMNLCARYFKSKDNRIFNRIEDLCRFERYSFIRSASNSFYFCGLKPFSNHINIYKYDKLINKSLLKKSLNLPFHAEHNLNALVLHDEKYIAIIGGVKGGDQKLYLYNLTDNSAEPVTVINNVIDKPVSPGNEGFFFTTDNLSAKDELSGTNSLYHCTYSDDDGKFRIISERVYVDEYYNIHKSFDSAFDSESNDIFIGSYESNTSDNYKIESINLETKRTEEVKKLKVGNNEELRLCGADDINIYIVGTNKTFRGTLYLINRETLKTDTILSNTAMPVQDFSLVKNHALIYFQGHNANRAFLINKHTKSIEELPIEDGCYYRFYRNKMSNMVYYQKESLTTPREIYAVDLTEVSKAKRINVRSDLPFNPENYITENVSVKSESGSNINLQLTYKKGMVKDGSNPLFFCSFINSEESFLDKFYLSRILYMDHGYIFVQRAKSDSKKRILLENQIKDISTSIRYLVKEKYTSDDKIALFGKEYGATAIMQLLNNNEDIKAPVILMDGVYDLIGYSDKGKLLYNNERLFHINNTESLNKLLDSSPYHNVIHKRSYPPILLMSSNENLSIQKSHTYKMTAKLQMRTRGFHPIIMLTPERINQLEEYNDYTYTVFIEHAFWFLSRNLGIAVE